MHFCRGEIKCDGLLSSAQHLASMARHYPRTTMTDFSCTKSPARKGRKGKSEDKSIPADGLACLHLKQTGKGKNPLCFILMVCGAALPNISRRKYESEILRELLQQRSSLLNPHLLSRALRNPVHMVYLHCNRGRARVRPSAGPSNEKRLAWEQWLVLEQMTDQLENQDT